MILIVALVVSCGTNNAPEERLKALIRDNLPIGSSASNIVTFLESQGIEQFGLQEDEEPVFTPSAAHAKPETKRYVLGRVKNVKSTLLKSWDLYIIFYFDRDDKLTNYEMRRIGSGL